MKPKYWHFQKGWEVGEDEGGQQRQLYGDRGSLDFGQWAYNAVHRWCILELFTWHLYNVTNQCHPNKFF